MDTYENNDFGEDKDYGEQPAAEAEPAHTEAEYVAPTHAEPPREEPPQVEPQCVRQENGKRSPFANSPYVNPNAGWQPGYGYEKPYTYTRPAYTPPSPEIKKEKSGGKGWKRFLCAVLVLGVVAAGCGITSSVVNKKWEGRYSSLEASMAEKLAALEKKINKNSYVGTGDSISGSPSATVGGLTPAQVYARSVDSVVAINCTVMVTNFGQMAESASSGSGFVLTKDGYIVSNYHVVAGASEISVTLYDGTMYKAAYVGGDENNDIALLKVDGAELQPVTVGSAENLIVGDQVVAIGNPLGELAATLTVGYVSAKDRLITSDGTRINMLQTDAAINPGNSGGPLFNMKGEVVGITSAKYSGTTSSGASIEGIGFAIPMDDVTDMLEDLKAFGYVTGAYLGVSVGDVEEDVANRYGLPMGALVAEVVSGSCADVGGIRPQDIIVNLGGHDVSNVNDLTRALRKFEPGEKITVTVYRYGAGETQLELTLDEKPQETQKQEPAVEESLPSNGSYDDWFEHFFG